MHLLLNNSIARFGLCSNLLAKESKLESQTQNVVLSAKLPISVFQLNQLGRLNK